MKKEKWIIAACSSEGDGIEFLRIDGSIRLIKEKLINMVKKDMVEEGFESGSTRTEELEVNDGEIKAYSNFSDFHIDYAAIRCL